MGVEKLTEYDSCPVYLVKDENFEVMEIARDDRKEFLERHSGHKIGYLEKLDEEVNADNCFFDSKRESIFKATDGKLTYLIRAWRKSAADKMIYELVETETKKILLHLKLS